MRNARSDHQQDQTNICKARIKNVRIKQVQIFNYMQNVLSESRRVTGIRNDSSKGPERRRCIVIEKDSSQRLRLPKQHWNSEWFLPEAKKNRRCIETAKDSFQRIRKIRWNTEWLIPKILKAEVSLEYRRIISKGSESRKCIGSAMDYLQKLGKPTVYWNNEGFFPKPQKESSIVIATQRWIPGTGSESRRCTGMANDTFEWLSKVLRNMYLCILQTT